MDNDWSWIRDIAWHEDWFYEILKPRKSKIKQRKVKPKESFTVGKLATSYLPCFILLTGILGNSIVVLQYI